VRSAECGVCSTLQCNGTLTTLAHQGTEVPQYLGEPKATGTQPARSCGITRYVGTMVHWYVSTFVRWYLGWLEYLGGPKKTGTQPARSASKVPCLESACCPGGCRQNLEL